MNTISNYNSRSQNIGFKAQYGQQISGEFLSKVLNKDADVLNKLQISHTINEGINFIKNMSPNIGKESDVLALRSNTEFNTITLSLNDDFHTDINYMDINSFIKAPKKLMKKMAKRTAEEIKPLQIKNVNELPKQNIENLKAITNLNTMG